MSMNSTRRTGRDGSQVRHEAFQKIEHVDLTDRTCEEIRRRILRRELPTGAQIRVETVAAQLGVSRTPVLDALRQLAAEGLVDIAPRRGCFVRPLLVSDVREIFDAREAVELFCTRSAITEQRNTGLAETLTTFIAEMERQVCGESFEDYEAFTSADRSFHDSIVGLTNNARLIDIYGNLNVHMHVMRVHLFQQLEAPTRVLMDHRKILSAIADGNVRAAEKATIDHLRGIRAKMIDHLEHAGGSI